MGYQLKPTTKLQKNLERVEKRGYRIDFLVMVIKKLVAGIGINNMQMDLT